MPDLSVLLVGSRSFLAQEFLAHPNNLDLTTAGHGDPDLDRKIEASDVIISFAFNPALRTAAYDETLDFDAALAKKIAGGHQRLAVMSTRMVYGPYSGTPFRETAQPAPIAENIYAVNKLKTENAVRKILGERALILRLGNIFGFEYPRPRDTFMSALLRRLKEKNEMFFDIAPASAKDFLPAADFARILSVLIRQGAHGVCNVGSGRVLSMETLANAVKSGYGNCSIRFEGSRIDSFCLDVAKLRALNIPLPDEPKIEESFRIIGRQLSQL